MKIKALKIAVASAVLLSALATTGCAGFNERNDAIREGWERAGVTKEMDANWHYFDKTDPYATSMSGGN